MRRVLLSLLVLVLLVGGALAVYVYRETRPPVGPVGRRALDEQDFALIERGRYLTAVADCAACHTVPGGKPFAGGRPIETPFGIILAPNITPDRATGIGSWSDAAFDAALREGKRADGQPLYPAMPYSSYTKMPREDVLAIRAYLNTVAPVENEVVADQLPFPLNIRAAMLAWNTLYFRPGEFRPDPGQSDLWNRGAYLVEGPGHCGACHTPKSVLGGDERSRVYQGYSIQDWFAPAITNDERLGLGRWSEAEVVSYLKTGHNSFAAASGPMAEEVALSSSRMTDADLSAIATYLKSLPGHDTAASPVPGSDPVMTAGAAIYRDSCSACHAPDGAGVPRLFPRLASSSFVSGREPTTVLRVILAGARSVATDGAPTGPAMPSYAWQLSDEQVAAVTTYIRSSFGNAAAPVTPDMAAKARQHLAARRD